MKKSKRESKKKTALSERDILIKNQAERIAELKKENAELLQNLESCRAKENEIADTLSFTKRKQEEILNEAKIKYALECERIKSFRKKWTDAAKEGILRANYALTEKTLRECQLEMEEALSMKIGDAGKSYVEERDRLDDDPGLNYSAFLPETSSEKFPGEIEELSEKELGELLEQLDG